MEIAVADMTDNWCQDMAFFYVALRLGNAFSQPRYWNASVSDHHGCARAQREIGQCRVVARLPQAGAFLGTRGPSERASTKFGCNLSESLGLLGNRSFRAVEFKKEHRSLRQAEIGVHVARPYLPRAQKFHTRPGHPALHRMHRRTPAPLPPPHRTAAPRAPPR